MKKTVLKLKCLKIELKLFSRILKIYSVKELARYWNEINKKIVKGLQFEIKLHIEMKLMKIMLKNYRLKWS